MYIGIGTVVLHPGKPFDHLHGPALSPDLGKQRAGRLAPGLS
jgi:hypothetical protein